MTTTQRETSPGHVYAMLRDDGAIKVGCSGSPDERCEALKRDHAGLRVVHYSKRHGRARKIETIAQRLLKAAGKHIEKEWFCVSVREAMDAIEQAERIYYGLEPAPASIRVPPDECKPNGDVVYIRADAKFRAAIELIRSHQEPTLSIADTVRQAVFEKAKQYAKPNGGHRNGK